MPDAGEPFSRLTLDGERFAHARLPIDALIELQRYREIVLEAAKQAYMRETGLAVVPDNFETEFDLGFTKVEVGSATPLLDKPASQYDSYYETGRDEIEAGFASIINHNFAPDSPVAPTGEIVVDDNGSNEATPSEVPFSLAPDAEAIAFLIDLPAFREFGSSLQPNEVLRLFESSVRESVEVTAATAVERILPYVEFVERSRSLPDEPTVTSKKYVSTAAGRLIAINAEKMNFAMETLHFGEVHGRYDDPDMTENLKAVLDSSSQAPLVRVTGRMSWRDGTLYRILNIDDVELLEIESEPWSRRFIELASLPESWHPDEPSDLIAFVAIDAAREVLRQVADLDHQQSIFGEASGGVTVEWVTPSHVISLEILPSATFFLFTLDTAAGEAVETETDNLYEIIEQIKEALA